MFDAIAAQPVALLLVALIVILSAIALGYAYVIRRVERRLYEYERYRRRQHADLVERVERSDERTAHDLQLMNAMLGESAKRNEDRMEKLLGRLEQSVEQQRAQNDMLRDTVDKRLRETLEKRLGESFRSVSEQLERVYRGLGEMQNLAGSVGDLKRVLTGVKTRGVWGEVMCEALLEQTLTADQYVKNTPVEPGGVERVEFAVKLPGRDEGMPVLLPIDAKFPQEDYRRLLDAQEKGDKSTAEAAALALERALMEQAKRISDKYIRVPNTTDFAVMFLPVEGLYAEALRRAGLCEKMQRRYHVLISGPATLSALLSSLQMGFRTLAVERRSEEIWRLLGSVRSEFLRFGDALERTRQRLDQANAELDAAATRTRQINKQLKTADDLSVPAAWKEEPADRR